MPDDFRGVLIYDGECPFCSAASTALRRVEAVGTVSWFEDEAQAFLDAQFDEAPFAVAFVDRSEERVYVGREAARELCDRAGMPVLVRDIVGDNYEAVADAVQRVTDRDAEPDPRHGVVPLSPAGREAYSDLAAAAEDASLSRHLNR